MAKNDGSHPCDPQQCLNDLWALVRAKLNVKNALENWTTTPFEPLAGLADGLLIGRSVVLCPFFFQ